MFTNTAQNTLPASEDARPRGRWLVAARTAWLIFVLFDLVFFIASIPAYAAQLTTVCADPSRVTCGYAQLSAADLKTLERLGITDTAYVAYTLAIHGVRRSCSSWSEP